MFRGDFRDWKFYILLAFLLLILPIVIAVFALYMVRLKKEQREMQRIADATRGRGIIGIGLINED